ncbi:MAG: hypothetical protein ACHQF3_00100 [Alphaproteobacteria bacterium]
MLALVKAGVPWEVATKLSPARRLAYIVALGELQGGKFDWDTMSWKEPRQ